MDCFICSHSSSISALLTCPLGLSSGGQGSTLVPPVISVHVALVAGWVSCFCVLFSGQFLVGPLACSISAGFDEGHWFRWVPLATASLGATRLIALGREEGTWERSRENMKE